MVRIRLRRQGAKGQPTYRIVVIDQRKARNGKYLENIGYYNPRTRPATEVIKEDRALYWLSVGAQPSDPVRRILDHTGTWERFQRLRTGESMEALVKEAEENKPEPPSPKTNYPAPEPPKPIPPAPEPPKSIPPEPEPPKPIPPTPEPPKLIPPAPEPPKPIPPVPESPKPIRPAPEPPKPIPPKSGLYRNLNRPGKTQLNDTFTQPMPLRDPINRAKRKKQQFEKARKNEPDISERTRQVLTKKWDGKDPATGEFLKQQYKGKCQICNTTFPKLDGEPYFEALYIESCTIASWLDDPANTLCLCPEHVAKFLYGAREFTPDFRDQVKSYRGGPEHHLEVQLIGEQKRIRFTQRHIVDLKALMEVIENL